MVLSVASGSNLYVATNLAKIPDLDKAIKAKDSKTLDAMTTKGEIASVTAETPVVYVKHHPAIGDDVSEVRVVDGPLKDKVVFCHTSAVKKVDPAKVAIQGEDRQEAEARTAQ